MTRLVCAAALASFILSGIAGCGGAGDRITLVGRQNNSGTYDYFREAILGKEGQFRQGISAQNGSKDVVELVGKTPSAIGYSGMGYATGEVKMLRVAKKKGDTPVEPTIENARSGSYPLARPLFIFTAGEPSPAAQHYLAWIHSSAGQEFVSTEGYVPNVEVGPSPDGNPPGGTIRVEGSDTMIQLAGKWAEVYMKAHPNVKIVVQGGGSGKGISSLMAGATDLCNSSRDMKDEERAEIKKKTGKEVVEHTIGLDALAIYVHPSNPLEAITDEELKEIFGKDGKVTLWSQLTGEAQ